MNDDISGFETRLLEKMAQRGISQADLCRKTGFASSMISHYCTGQRVPSFAVVARIAKALGTTVDFLAYGNQQKRTRPTPDRLAVAENAKDYESSFPASDKFEEIAPLINMFNSLNVEGKAKVISYIKDIYSIDNYLLEDADMSAE